LGHSDGRHEVRNLKQEFKLLFKPQIDTIILTLGAVPVSAGMITIMESIAHFAKIFLSAHDRGSAGFNMPHHLLMGRQDLFIVLFEIFGSVMADNVCY